jgi:hypothetical protein
MAYDKSKQQADLERFFNDCVRYWERTLKTDSDLDRQPFLNALNELPHCCPFVMNGEPFDDEVLRDFKKARLMDAYGLDWERHWEEHSPFIKKEGCA